MSDDDHDRKFEAIDREFEDDEEADYIDPRLLCPGCGEFPCYKGPRRGACIYD